MSKSSYIELSNVMDAMIENPHMFFVVVNAEGKLISISQTLLNLLEMTEEEALGKYILDVIPDGKLPEVLRTGRIHDADVLWVNGHKTIVTRVPIYKNGEIVGAVCSSLFMDISTAQDLLERFNTQVPEPDLDLVLNELIDNPSIGYIIVDANGIVTHVNQTYLNVLGKTRREVIGKPITEITPGTKLPETLATGKIDTVDVWTVNNHSMLVNRLPIKSKGKIVGAIAHTLVLGKSVHQFLLDKLQETDGVIFEGLIENPHTGYVAVDKHGIVTLINKTMLDALNLKESDVVGKYILDVIPNSKLPEILATGRTDRADVFTLSPGRDILVDRMPIRKDGEIIGAIARSVVMDMSEVRYLIQKLQDTQQELNLYKDAVCSIYKAKWRFENLIGQNYEFTNIVTMAKQFSRTSSTLLITGESGTGKELFAQAIHNASPRCNGPFIRINCAALPESLLESELFGYADGAFTGAKKGGKPGKFELANGGTIFLDEIGDMPMSMQTKLLTVLQEKVIERVGGTTPIQINVRIIAATNRDLEEMVRNHEFRDDLYYRLNVVQLKLPPLRRRMDDLPLLTEDLIKRLNAKLETSIKGISDQAMQLLLNYHWPGNIRELENLLERAINLAHMHGRDIIEPPDFPSLCVCPDGQVPFESDESKTLPERIDELEKQLIMQALEKSDGNKTQAAKMLGIHSSALYRKLKKYNLE
ncbi:MAG TPA: sigma 54-interacting transcriptional regulator [Syntrophomonadaceae bacterium]|nr:sigma 54-interacting transcriptional regulator [Syntrophomonadaceae bacterium]